VLTTAGHRGMRRSKDDVEVLEEKKEKKKTKGET
jgi:hypothetical protein